MQEIKLNQTNGFDREIHNRKTSELTELETLKINYEKQGHYVVGLKKSFEHIISSFFNTTNKCQCSLQDSLGQYRSIAIAVERIENMAVEMGKVAKLTTGISDSLVQLNSAAVNGQSVIQNLEQAMAKMTENISFIESFIGIINSLSDDIKFLALNASIEASRAGEFGKGFAVIAGEVKNLAVDTKANAESITDTIGNTIKSIKNSQDTTLKVKAVYGQFAKQVEMIKESVKAVKETNDLQKKEAIELIFDFSDFDDSIKNSDKIINEIEENCQKLKEEYKQIKSLSESSVDLMGDVAT